MTLMVSSMPAFGNIGHLKHSSRVIRLKIWRVNLIGRPILIAVDVIERGQHWVAMLRAVGEAIMFHVPWSTLGVDGIL